MNQTLNPDRWVVVHVTVPDAGGPTFIVERLRSRVRGMITPTHSRAVAEQEARRLNERDAQKQRRSR